MGMSSNSKALTTTSNAVISAKSEAEFFKGYYKLALIKKFKVLEKMFAQLQGEVEQVVNEETQGSADREELDE